ncbi:MAG: zf-HC2 domain-containing protein [Planctomycetes bacterium]|nr:zf-HC2 domain-containing protein [Planctomycetota bacterium]
MRCEQARQLFDAYLDGELSPALATELGAHRLRCAECRRALALLEVAGHIVGADADPVRPPEGFTDRLLACMEPSRATWSHRLRRLVYAGSALAAAAVVGLAFLGVFDTHRPGQVAGKKVERSVASASVAPAPVANPPVADSAIDEFDEEFDAPDSPLQTWIERTQANLEAKRQGGESLQEVFDLTILQWLDVLEQAKQATADAPTAPPALDPAPTARPLPPTPSEDD